MNVPSPWRTRPPTGSNAHRSEVRSPLPHPLPHVLSRLLPRGPFLPLPRQLPHRLLRLLLRPLPHQPSRPRSRLPPPSLFRRLPGVALLVAGLVLAGCSNQAGTSPPTVLLTSPATGATGVSNDAELRIVFSEAMSRPSVKVTATPDPGLDGGRWTSADTVVFDAPSGWQLDTTFTVSIAGRNLAGKALAAGTSVTFHTAATSSIGAPATPTNVIAEAGDGSIDVSWNANGEPDLAGYTVYWGPADAAPESAMFVAVPDTTATILGAQNAHAYDVTVDAVDTEGLHSEPSAAQQVTPVDTTPPTLMSTEPADGTSDLTLVPVVRLTFSEPMNTSSLSIGLCTSSDAPAAATCPSPTQAGLAAPDWSAGDTVATFDTTGVFASGTTYVLVVDARDAAGNALTSTVPIAFSLAVVPDTTPPHVRAAFGPTQAVPTFGFDFSEAMNQESVEAAFLSQPAVTCNWTWANVTATCTVTSGLRQLTDYVVTIATTATDSAGNPMTVPFQTTFPTSDFNPWVVGVQPANGRFGVSATAPITLTFSEPMNTGVTSAAFSVATSVAVAGSTSWNPDATQMVFTPSTSYGHGTFVTWTLSVAATDAGGTPLESQASGNFRTEAVLQGVR